MKFNFTPVSPREPMRLEDLVGQTIMVAKENGPMVTWDGEYKLTLYLLARYSALPLMYIQIPVIMERIGNREVKRPLRAIRLQAIQMSQEFIQEYLDTWDKDGRFK